MVEDALFKSWLTPINISKSNLIDDHAEINAVTNLKRGEMQNVFSFAMETQQILALKFVQYLIKLMSCKLYMVLQEDMEQINS